MAWQKINSSLIKKSVRRAGIEEGVIAAKALDLFNQYLKENFGQAVKKQAKPLYLKNRVLTIALTSSPLAAELKSREKEILQFINSQLDLKIKRLRFYSK